MNSQESDIQKENEKLYEVLEVSAFIASSLNLGSVLGNLMEKAKQVCQAEASSLMLVDEENQELFFHTVRGEKSEAIKKIRLKMGEGIAGWVAKNAEAVLVEDCAKDPRFFKKADQMSDFHTRSMMCVPLIARNRVLGTVQVLNKENEELFNKLDLRIFQVLANQAAIAIDNARLHEMATVDAMTGLYMKSYFLARFEEEFRRAKIDGRPISMIMSDIDHFKKVNDDYGHHGADFALIELARVIRETVEELGGQELAGRYGGEEFCVLMPNAGPERAREIGELIRKRIEAEPIHIEDKVAKITISVGVACYPLHESVLKEPEDFIKYADEALYVCKNKGRNCVSLYGET